jgi:hypothetical protein
MEHPQRSKQDRRRFLENNYPETKRLIDKISVFFIPSRYNENIIDKDQAGFL